MLIAVLIVLSIVQALFGMGLLLFGTPTLLLQGYSFIDALSILLPPSVTISALQIVFSKKDFDTLFIRKFSIFCLPMVAFGLMLIMNFGDYSKINILLAMALLFSIATRVFSPLQLAIKKTLIKISIPFMAMMGFVHGVTNMGGSLLSVYASTIHKDKESILQCVSTGYFFFGIVQVVSLMLMGNLNLVDETYLFCALSALAYIFLGRKIFININNSNYHHWFTVFMFLYAVLLISDYLNWL